MQKCARGPIKTKIEGKHTIPAQATRVIHASVTVSKDHPITGTAQLLPQFEETAKLIVAPGITIARDKCVAIKIANTTDFPNELNTHTKQAGLQILKPEKNEMTTITEHHHVVAYVNALKQVDPPENTEENFWFPTPENPGEELEHTAIQQRILRELRELEQLNPERVGNFRTQFLSMFK